MGQLEDYVRYWREQGYTDDNLRENLTSQGYDPAEVEAALGGKSSDTSLKAAVVVIVWLIAVGFLATWFFFPTGDNAPGSDATLPDDDWAIEEGNGTDASATASPPLGEGDISECLGHDILHERTACIRRVANRTGDLTTCDKMEGQDDRVECRAFVTRDLSMCSSIERAAKRDLCITNLVAGASDPAVCRAITDIGPRDVCLFNVATSRKDPAICEEMSEHSYYKAQCLQSSAIGTPDTNVTPE